MTVRCRFQRSVGILNFYSKLYTGLLCCFLLTPAFALDLQGLYSTSCTRDIGVILGVNRTHIYLLNLTGKVIAVPRYDIVGIASYPINHIPISTIELPKALSSAINFYRIKTKFNKTLVDLVEGWPIGFSKNKISFLDKDGGEIAVQRKNIWSIEVLPSAEKRIFSNPVQYQYDFLHPASMAKCPKQLKGNQATGAKKIEIVPQEFISDPITIKRKFDETQKNHKKVHMYVRSQKFYPVPQVYKNIVTLGFWAALGSRYGSSDNRNNNGAPILIEEFSSGPFGYQHIFLTGAAPNGLLIHEEPQTQLFYRFKADYFHMSVLFDPNAILVGKKFKWQEKEINKGEQRTIENLFIETGLDFGHFSLILIPVSSVYIGTKIQDAATGHFKFDVNNMQLPRYGIGYHNHWFKADVVYGQQSETFGEGYQLNEANTEYIYFPGIDYQLSFLRINNEFEFWQKYKLSHSFIQKRLEANHFSASSLTTAFYLDYQLNFKYLIKSFLAYERTTSNQRKTGHHLKFGMNFSIIF